jgi:hypothetical protein
MYVRKLLSGRERWPRYLLVEYVPDGKGGRRRQTLYDLRHHATVGQRLRFLRGEADWYRRWPTTTDALRERGLRRALHLDEEADRLLEMVTKGDVARAARGRAPLLPAKPRRKKGGK